MAASQTSPAIHFEDVSKRFASQRVLEQVSLRVEDGEFFGLVGINGVGKTTCIKALLDFCAVDAGSMRIYGVSSRVPEARRPLAYLPERFLPPYYLKGGDFLAYMARLHGSAPESGRIEAAFAALDLDPAALGKPVRDFSKGMAQKLGLAGCFLAGKPLLILDEPMSGLDPKARLLVKRELSRLRAGGRTLFFSTHLLADVDELCDRMAILHDGRLRFVGTPAECRERYAAQTLEQAYLACIS